MICCQSPACLKFYFLAVYFRSERNQEMTYTSPFFIVERIISGSLVSSGSKQQAIMIGWARFWVLGCWEWRESPLWTNVLPAPNHSCLNLQLLSVPESL